MSARIPPGYCEAWFQFGNVLDPDPWFCALGLSLEGGASATQALADAILATHLATVDNMCSSDTTLGPGYVLFGNDGGDIRIDGTASIVNGAIGSTMLPQNTAVLVRKTSASGGRRNRGRMFIPGAPEGNVGATGNLTSAYRTICQNTMDTWRAQLQGVVGVDNLVILHDSAPFAPTVITSLEVQPVVATQRRRLRR